MRAERSRSFEPCTARRFLSDCQPAGILASTSVRMPSCPKLEAVVSNVRSSESRQQGHGSRSLWELPSPSLLRGWSSESRSV